MKISIDKQNNIVRFMLRDSPIAESDETAGGLIYDFDENNNVVGLEFLNASERLGDLDLLETSTKTSRRKKLAKAVEAQHEYAVCGS